MPRFWLRVLEFGLVLWVVRVPLLISAAGLLLLSLAPQAQDLFMDWITPELTAPPFGTAWLGFHASWIWERIAKPCLFLVVLFAVWAAPVHYAARLLLARDRRYQDRKRSRPLELAVPRLLGSLAFVAVLCGVYRAWRHLPYSGDEALLAAAELELACIAVGTCAAMLLFEIYVKARAAYVRRQRAALEAGAGDSNPFRPYRALRFFISPSAGILYLALVSVTSVLVIVIGATETSRFFSRALALPLILGGWLPLLTLASHYGRELRVPIISLSVATVAVLTWVLGDNHTVRRYPGGEAPSGRPQALDLEEALRLWRNANCPPAPGQPDAVGSSPICPRPLIVAAAGGASRAAFFTASALGFLFDLTSPGDGSEPRKWDATRARNRLFALSAVSGGAIGAAMTVAALKDAPDGRPPCRLAVAPGETWFGREIGDWRDCLEAMLAGDFLTPVVIGLSFHDMLPFVPWPDRAVLLERAWEDRYAKLVDAGIPRRAGRCVGLGCPFSSFRPEENAWLPLLILNGTSVATGQRIVTTILAPEYEKPSQENCPIRGRNPDGTQKERCRIFSETYRFHDFLVDDGDPDAHSSPLARALAALQARIADRSRTAEIRLSTAALNSARFPIISPAGEIRNARHRVVDRIVDGGYFENYGASSALDLARAIKTLDPRLDPFVLVISNDPEASVDLEQFIPTADRRHVTGLLFPDAPKGGFMSAITSPITAFANTRNARGTLAVDQLRAEMRLLNDIPDEDRNVAHLRVAPQIESSGRFRPLSMSWWLSKPVQARLHEQVECGHNEEELREILKVLDSQVAPPIKKCRQN